MNGLKHTFLALHLRLASYCLLLPLGCLMSPLPTAGGIEVVANGFTLWRGAQIAVDTTLVSPILQRDGCARPGQRWHLASQGTQAPPLA